MKFHVLITLFVLNCFAAFPQPFPFTNSSEILLGLKRLNMVGSVLYIAAHPDDENTRLLTYLTKERKLKTAYLSITRGDGGQNLIGNEQGEALGLIRTQELLAARKIDGAEQFFTRANDFGYSKNPEETFKIWNKDSVLSDVVLTIRRIKPDVIICRFPTTGEGGHGHHTASAILAQEAFEAAADPNKFSWQLKTTSTWQSKKLFWNTFNFGNINTTSPEQLKIEVGGYNSLIGKSYGEIAAESRSMHKSQGFGTTKQRGSSLEYFKLLKGNSVINDLFENIDLSWKRFPGTEKVQKLIDNCIQTYTPEHPEKSISQLAEIYKEMDNIEGQTMEIKHWKQIKLEETKALLISCAGLHAEALADAFSVVPGESVKINVQFICRNQCRLKINKVSFFDGSDTTLQLEPKNNQLISFVRLCKISEIIPYSNPYWLNEKHSEGMYAVAYDSLIGKAENNPFTRATVYFDLEGVNLSWNRTIVHKSTHPVKGEIYRLLEILPALTINLPEKVLIFENGASKKIKLSIRSNTESVEGTLNLKMPEGWSVSIPDPNFKLKNKNDETLIEAEISPGKTSMNGLLYASASIKNNTYANAIKRIEYEHIPQQFILSVAECKLVRLDIKKKNSKIGFIPGPGDEVMASLQQIGYSVKMMNDTELSKGDLSQYDAIVTGVRAYNTNEKLPLNYNRLMDYVRNGGNLIVQYNTNNQFGPLQTKIGPYPFNISRNRVTNEKAEVKFIKPEHKALNWPNKLSKSDFEDWIQERGIYFAEELDAHYETLLSMADNGEKEDGGSLIIGKYGKGNFVYTGLSFFRQLPAGVPGAYRLFVNLISLPKN